MIRITSSIIQIGSESYPIKNIASFGDYYRDEVRLISPERQKKIRKRRLIFAATVGIVFPAFCLYFLYPIIDNYFPWEVRYRIPGVATLMWICGTIGFLGFLFAFNKKKEIVRAYAVRLVQNSGEPVFIWTDSYSFRDQISRLVETAITSSSEVSYQVNIEKQEINNNSSTLIDRRVTNNYDYSINYNQYPGLTEGQLNFLSKDFDAAISQMASLFQSRGAQDRKELVDNLVAAIKQSGSETTENRVGVKQAFQKLKTACETMDLGKSAWEALTLIASGVTMLAGVS